MSSVLRTAAESTANVLSDLVDEARDRLEELPPIARVRRRRSQDRRWMVILAVVAVLFVAMMVRRRSHRSAETVAQGTFTEKKMATSAS
jgi:hypothetical protein